MKKLLRNSRRLPDGKSKLTHCPGLFNLSKQNWNPSCEMSSVNNLGYRKFVQFGTGLWKRRLFKSRIRWTPCKFWHNMSFYNYWQCILTRTYLSLVPNEPKIKVYGISYVNVNAVFPPPKKNTRQLHKTVKNISTLPTK